MRALISDQILTINVGKTLIALCDVVDGWQQECALLEAQNKQLRDAGQKAFEAMAGNNNPFDPEFWASAVDSLGAALAATEEKG